MKRRNADTGKLRRPIKRTKITEGMYGNSMLYLKFILVWASVVLADYMLEFRFEFLWPLWMLRSIYDTYKYQGLAFSVFFICIALTSDMICFFFIPIQYIFFAASTYVWVQYVWYTFADKGICLPTVAICCLIVYTEGLRAAWVRTGAWGARPLAAHCVGWPAVTLGVAVKRLVLRRLRLRTQRLVRAQNEFIFQLMRDAVPPSEAVCECPTSCGTKHMNGGGRRKHKPELNGHCVTDKSENTESTEKKVTRERDKSQNNTSHTHSLTNGNVSGPGCHEHTDKQNHCKGSTKSSKYDKKEAATLKEEKKEERRRNKREKDKESSDSHKSTEQTKEQIVKEVESTKEVRNKDSSSKDKDKEKERERETREREKEREKEKERERERERELREARECTEELKRVKAELAASMTREAESRRALQAAQAADKLRRADLASLKQAHAALQHKVSTWRCTERAALERRLGEERRARARPDTLLTHANGECESPTCASRRAAAESESGTLRRELARVRERALQMQRDANAHNEQVRALESRLESASSGGPLARAAQLERALSAETRVKLDLLAALGDANRKMHIQDSVINRLEKELEELKAQLVAVMPAQLVPAPRLAPSPLDPNATVYTPKQLATDA